VFTPPGGSVAQGFFVLTAPGLPPYPEGFIFFTTNGTLPGHQSAVYAAGANGLAISGPETILAMSSTLGATCVDSPVVAATFTAGLPEAGGQ
jgi:hypothetical protein